MTLNEIATCKNCQLHKNQMALLDSPKKADIMWLGLSAKKVTDIKTSVPLDINTNTGKIISEIEKKCHNISFYKSNLVKCLPLSIDKLRYPTEKEICACKKNLMCELLYVRPRLVFCLGRKVFDSVKELSYLSEFSFTQFIHIEHPSYICVYKRNFINEYEEKVVRIIKEKLQ